MTTYEDSFASPSWSGTPQDIAPWTPPASSRVSAREQQSRERRELTWQGIAAFAAAAAIVFFILGVWQAVGTDVYASWRQSQLSANAPIFVEEPSFVQGTSGDAVPAMLAAIGAPDVKEGDVVARISIPAIDVDQIVVNGVSESDLRSGPGWMPWTSFLGEPGNAVISGHRTTYGGPFNRIDELVPGDQILIAIEGRPNAVYEVRELLTVGPEDVWVTEQTDGARLTLTTCAPKGGATHRLIVQAELVEGDFTEYALSADSWTASTSG